MQIEICCNSLLSATNAATAGAPRIELCRNLEVGGLTPSPNDVLYCAHHLNIRTHVLIRPREGNFCYSDDEYAQMKDELLMARNNGAAAVVVGFLTPDGAVDTLRTSQFVQLAAPLEVTFHRAFDELHQDPLKALEDVISCGCHRILTSGCKPTAVEGIPLLQQLLQRAAGRITLLVGSGVTPSTAPLLLDKLLPFATSPSALELHGSCKQRLSNGETATDPALVKDLLNIAQQYSTPQK